MKLKLISGWYVRRAEAETCYCAVGWMAHQAGVSDEVLEAADGNRIDYMYTNNPPLRPPTRKALETIRQAIYRKYRIGVGVLSIIQSANDGFDDEYVESILRDYGAITEFDGIVFVQGVSR